ncbi:hypothetical protein BpHYR1_010641 [Brachionus plicatilis]|uniref:Uncharacterized protein n=1 Tax=Brachionus plicatilis TaxID=10195 RepID=A0A3M7PAR4_BRAPC|nr:hypothetical protein BpHYR1_010641 [Brachionus plicatilis]
MIYLLLDKFFPRNLPRASEVLNCYLKQQNYPPWTSYFVKQKSVYNDQFKETYFINKTGGHEYLILRTGCFPFIKYHCTRLNEQDKKYLDEKFIHNQNLFFRFIKILNLGIPTLMYGIIGQCLITHVENTNFNLNIIKKEYVALIRLKLKNLIKL